MSDSYKTYLLAQAVENKDLNFWDLYTICGAQFCVDNYPLPHPFSCDYSNPNTSGGSLSYVAVVLFGNHSNDCIGTYCFSYEPESWLQFLMRLDSVYSKVQESINRSQGKY